MNRIFLSIFTISLFAISSVVIGCDEDEDTPDSPCAQAYEKICQKACDCSEDGCFYFIDGSSSDFTDEEGCFELNVEFSCEDEDYPSDLDFDACIAALDSASCEEHDLWSETGLELPVECEGL